jgi:hypothetical protein
VIVAGAGAVPRLGLVDTAQVRFLHLPGVLLLGMRTGRRADATEE